MSDEANPRSERSRLKTAYGDADFLCAKILAWDPLKNYAIVPNPRNPHGSLCILREAMHPDPPRKGASPHTVQGRWLVFQLKDVDFQPDGRYGKLRKAEFRHEEPPSEIRGQRVHVITSLWKRPKKKKPGIR